MLKRLLFITHVSMVCIYYDREEMGLPGWMRPGNLTPGMCLLWQ